MPTITIDENSLKILRNTKEILVKGGQNSNYSDSIRELAKSIVNLCQSCGYEFAECDGNPKFGNGKGNDNVYDCNNFMLRGDLMCENCFRFVDGIDDIKACGINLKYRECDGKYFVEM